MIARANEMIDQLEKLARLEPSGRTLIVSRPDVNLECEVAFGPIHESDGDEPARAVSHGYSTSGYVPEAIFHDILEKVLDKAQRRQAGPPSAPHARLLAVDLSTSRSDRTSTTARDSRPTSTTSSTRSASLSLAATTTSSPSASRHSTTG